MQSTISPSDAEESRLAHSLKESLVSRNENFDQTVKAEQLRLDLTFRFMRCPTNASRPDLALKWFEKLSQLHCEPQRHYHTLMHLEEMFLYLDIIKEHFTTVGKPMTDFDEEAIVLAVFFHDAIYDVHSSTNEEDSATLFQEYVRDLSTNGTKLQTGLEHLVVQCIIATKKHAVCADNPPCLALFLDLDMAVLGKETLAYLSYASLIRKEYNYVEHDTYCEKRADILEDFLKQPQIYGTQAVIEAFEQRARDNIRTEIEILRKGRIPESSYIKTSYE